MNETFQITQAPTLPQITPFQASIPFPFNDDTLFSIGIFEARWYALSYIGSVFIGWLILRRITSKAGDPVGARTVEALLNNGLIGIILGGRIGYVLFYNLPHYIEYPLDALKVWQGGMSFHGGLVGMLVAIGFSARRYKVRFFALADLVALVTPIGLFLGRLANFVNCELYGHPTDLPWAVTFNRGVCVQGGVIAAAGDAPRHPSQIYEALLEGVVLFALLAVLFRFGARERVGLLSGVFLIGYGMARGFVEFFREADAQIGYLLADWVTMGQILCVPMIAAGVIITATSKKG